MYKVDLCFSICTVWYTFQKEMKKGCVVSVESYIKKEASPDDYAKKCWFIIYKKTLFLNIRSCAQSLQNSLTCAANLTPFYVFYNLLDSPFKMFGEFTDLTLSIIGKVSLWVDLFGGGSWCLQTLMVSFFCATHSFDIFSRTKKRQRKSQHCKKCSIYVFQKKI